VAAAAGPEARLAESSSAGVEANARLTGLCRVSTLRGCTTTVMTWATIKTSMPRPANPIGLLLVPLTALRLGSTGWRMVVHYLGIEAYRHKGPPPLALVVHKASFCLWLAAVVIHVGFHLAKAVRLVLAD
jgi:hypothetical protein